MLGRTEKPTCGLFTSVSDLRKQARQLENEIDLKLVSFSKLGTGHGGVGYKSDRLVFISLVVSMFTEFKAKGPLKFAISNWQIDSLVKSLTLQNSKRCIRTSWDHNFLLC